MDLFSTEKHQAVYEYLETEKGLKSLQVFKRGLMSELKKIITENVKDVGTTLAVIDKVVISVKMSKAFDYKIFSKTDCVQLLELVRQIMNIKVLKVALYVFSGKTELSTDVQRALFYTLTGKQYTIVTADSTFKFMDERIYLNLEL